MRGFLIAVVTLAWPQLSVANATGPFDGLSPRLKERVACSIGAALKIGIPADLLLAVAEMEGGRAGEWSLNANGTSDGGPMQFNTRYLQHLQRRYGVDPQAATGYGCYPYELAAWRLSRHLRRDKGDTWTRVANYHSRTPSHNRKYRRKLLSKARKWKQWLQQRFPTTGVTIPQTGRVPVRERGRDSSGSAHSNDHRGQDGSEMDRELIAVLELLERHDPERTSRGGTPVQQSHSVGRPHSGSLLSAVRVLPHHAYDIRNPSRAWGTRAAVQWLASGFDGVTASTYGKVRVLDMSLENGGPMRGHRSHQSGRDVDLTYYRKGCRGACGLRAIGPVQLDAKTQWSVLSRWLTRRQVEFIFVDYALQAPLHAAARDAGASRQELERWFQYPRGKGHPSGVIRHVDNHRDHVHVRFRCTPKDGDCKATRSGTPEAAPARQYAPVSTVSLLELVDVDAEAEHEAMAALLR